MSALLAQRKLEIALWISAVILFGVYFAGRAFGELERRLALDSFSAMRMTARAERPQSLADGRLHPVALPTAQSTDADEVGVPDQSEWSPARIREYAASVAGPARAESAPIGLLRIARVGLMVPVYPDIDERNLNRGAGWVAGTAALDSPGNIGIAAHRDGYFRALRKVVVGDVLELESVDRLRTYRITEISIVDPTDVSVLDPTPGPAVTLVTCYPFFFVGSAPKRYIVRALAEQ
jgi:sortase A